MKQYNEVFELIENGEWDLTDFAVWLNDYSDQAYAEGRMDGYDSGYNDACNSIHDE